MGSLLALLLAVLVGGIARLLLERRQVVDWLENHTRISPAWTLAVAAVALTVVLVIAFNLVGA